MSLPAYKTAPAFPVVEEYRRLGVESQECHQGLTQYAEIAARFHAARFSGIEAHGGNANPEITANEAFNHADAFFVELAKRTAP